MKRHPAVEGRFYPGTKESIFNFFRKIEENPPVYMIPEKADKTIGVILPHAGHIYSAFQTIPFFSYLKKHEITPETFIILNPNHSGSGPDIALDPHESWVNCIGEIELDHELSTLLPYPADVRAQENEHSAEVIIPYMQYYFRESKFKILPICMKQINQRQAGKLAKELHQAILGTGRSVILIASSDFSHFLSPQEGRKKDNLVLKTIENRDVKELQKTVINNKISVCGYCPIMTLMAYCALFEADYTSTVLARGHSGEVVPSGSVVDYISILFHSKN